MLKTGQINNTALTLKMAISGVSTLLDPASTLKRVGPTYKLINRRTLQPRYKSPHIASAVNSCERIPPTIKHFVINAAPKKDFEKLHLSFKCSTVKLSSILVYVWALNY